MILQLPNRTLKEKWLEAFKDERWLVQRDQRVGVVVSAADKNRARLAALRADGQDYKMGELMTSKHLKRMQYKLINLFCTLLYYFQKWLWLRLRSLRRKSKSLPKSEADHRAVAPMKRNGTRSSDIQNCGVLTLLQS